MKLLIQSLKSVVKILIFVSNDYTYISVKVHTVLTLGASQYVCIELSKIKLIDICRLNGNNIIAFN